MTNSIWQSIIGGLISGGVLMLLVTTLAAMTWGRIKDRLDDHRECLTELFDRVSCNEKDISYLKGQSNGKKLI